MIGKISFKKNWSPARRTLTLLVMFLILPILVFYLCFYLAFILLWKKTNKFCRRTKFLTNFSPRQAKSGFIPILLSTALIIVFWACWLLFQLMFCIFYLVFSSLVLTALFTISLPVFYFYSVVILYRKVIVWRGRRVVRNIKANEKIQETYRNKDFPPRMSNYVGEVTVIEDNEVAP